MIGCKPYDMPEGVKAALKRLASACKRDGVHYLQPTFIDGKIAYVFVCEDEEAVTNLESDKRHALSIIDGDFHERRWVV